MKDTLKAAWNHGGSMFATFWIVIALYALGGYLVWAFMQLDAQFSRPLAGDVIPADVTQQIAWGTRAFSVIAGSMAIYFHVKDMPKWRTIFSILTGVAALILLLHAYGISAKIMQGQFDADKAITQVADVNTGAIEQQIADLMQERADVRADTQVTIDTYQRSIENITTDGLDNDDEAGIYAQKQQQALQARDERLGEIRTEIAALRSDARSVSSAATQEAAESDSFNPLFTFGARLSTWQWDPSIDPSNVHKFAWGVAFFTLFFGFGEILMMVSFTGGYAALKVVSERQSAQEKDPVRVEAGKKAAETRKRRQEKKIELKDPDGYRTQWWQDRVRKAQASAVGLQGIANYYFEPWTESELAGQLKVALKKKQITQDQYDDLTDPDRVERRKRERQEARERRTADEGQAPLQLTNGMDQSEKEKGDVDEHGSAGHVSGN